MVAFLDPAEVPKISRAEFVEIFSGKARTSKVASWSGYRSKAVDFLYNPALNVFNAAGFTFLDSCLFPAHRFFQNESESPIPQVFQPGSSKSMLGSHSLWGCSLGEPAGNGVLYICTCQLRDFEAVCGPTRGEPRMSISS